jgi:hypothetical protein
MRLTFPPSRGSVLFVALVFTSIMFLICLAYSQNITYISQDLEDSSAEVRALELAQCATSQRLAQIWYDVQTNANSTTPSSASISSILTTNLAQGIYNTAQDTTPPAGMFPSNPWNTITPFGMGSVYTRCDYYSPSPATFNPSTAPPNGFGQGAPPSSQTYIDLQLTTTASIPRGNVNNPSAYNWEYKTIQYIVRLNLTGKLSVFDFAYFVNNYAWMYGDSSQIRVYGNVGANADAGFTSPLVDGYIYTSLNPSLSALGVINGASGLSHDSLSNYQNGGGLPNGFQGYLDPTNPPYSGSTIAFPAGYNGNISQYTAEQPLPMPYLGDLTNYMTAAMNNNGTIQQLQPNGTWLTLVNGVYGNAIGQNGMYSTQNATTGVVTVQNIPNPIVSNPPNNAANYPNGNVALIGTAAQPLKITGPVVITNDLMIKGVISGQGCVYVGRNMNIMGNVTYLNPPTWKQGDTNFSSDLTNNDTKDMVGFGVKGSVIVGDYYNMLTGNNYYPTVAPYFETGFQNNQCESYQTDPTDASIGYYGVLPTNPPTGFSGNYLALDGGNRYNDTTTWTTNTPRYYYDSTFPYAYAQSLNSDVTMLQGIFYTNHLFGGREDNFTLYGSLVARDEGDVFTGYWYQFYDPRSYCGSATSSTVNIFLPQPPGYNVWLAQEASSAPYQSLFFTYNGN